MAVYLLAPAYNEAGSVIPLLDRIQTCGAVDAAVIVDDGSTDGTAERVERWTGLLPRKVIRHARNLGLGSAMATGIQWAVTNLKPDDVLVTMDADNTHDPSLIEALCVPLEHDADVVIASRFCANSREFGLPWQRKLLTRGASVLLHMARPVDNVRDYSSGYRAYRVAALTKAISVYGRQGLVTTTGFDCMAEILLRLAALGASFAEVPMQLHYERKEGKSKMPTLRTVLAYVRLLRSVPRRKSSA